MVVVMRGWHATIAALVAVAMVLQIVVAIRVSGAPPSVATGVLRGTSLIGRLVRVFSFFTVQSNILAGVVSAQLAMRPHRAGRWWRPLRLAALCGITVTGVVYSAVLAGAHQPHGTTETVVNALFHYAVPLLMVVGWFAFGPRPCISRRAVSLSLLFPAGWLIYTLLRGALWNWYPYPFLDVHAHGYPPVLGNCVLVTILLAGVAGAYYVGDRRLPAAPPSSDTTYENPSFSMN